MKLNQKGAVDLVFAAVLIVLIAAGAFAVWRMQSTDETGDEKTTSSADQSSEQGSEQYADDNVSFSYPADWVVDTEQLAVDTLFLSPNYEPDNERGYRSANKGAAFQLSYLPNTLDWTLEDIIAEFEQQSSEEDSYLEFEEIMTRDGVRFVVGASIDRDVANATYIFESPFPHEESPDIESAGFSYLSYIDVPVVDGKPSLETAQFRDEFMRAVDSHRFIEQ